MGPLTVTERIAYIPARTQPLSAEIGIVRGDSRLWLFDVGSGTVPLKALQALSGEKHAVLSHFHPDHTANWSACGCAQLYCSRNTRSHLPEECPVPAAVVSEALTLHDGVELRVFPLPSCHARGCLGLEVDGRYAFVGDALYGTAKNGRRAYNVSVLKQSIDALRALRAETLLVSHHVPFLRPRSAVLAELETVYASRTPQEPYIFV